MCDGYLEEDDIRDFNVRKMILWLKVFLFFEWIILYLLYDWLL